MTGMIVCLLVLSVLADLMAGRIPNALTLTGLVAGLLAAYVRAGPSGLLQAAAAAGAMLLVGYLLFAIRALRGGDGKLLAVLGAFLGLHTAGRALLLSFFLAALMGIPAVLKNRGRQPTHIPYSVPLALAGLFLLY